MVEFCDILLWLKEIYYKIDDRLNYWKILIFFIRKTFADSAKTRDFILMPLLIMKGNKEMQRSMQADILISIWNIFSKFLIQNAALRNKLATVDIHRQSYVNARAENEVTCNYCLGTFFFE